MNKYICLINLRLNLKLNKATVFNISYENNRKTHHEKILITENVIFFRRITKVSIF